MRVCWPVAFGLVLVSIAACTRSEPAATIRLTVPDSLECMRDYSYREGEDPAPAIELMHAAVDRGEPQAILCRLSFTVGRGRDYTEFQLLYRYYRATGLVPERLDERARSMDRDELANRILGTHRFSPELSMFGYNIWNCRAYDAMAVDLLLRAPPGADMTCLPR